MVIEKKDTKMHKRHKGVEKDAKRLKKTQNIQMHNTTPQKDTKDTNMQSDPQKDTMDTKDTGLYPIFVSNSASTKKDTSTAGF